MKQSILLFRSLPFVLLSLVLPMHAAQDSTEAITTQTATQSLESAPASTQTPTQQPSSFEKSQPAVQIGAEHATPSTAAQINPADSLNNGVENMRREAARLRAEAKALRELSDTLNRASNEAEKKADEARDNADKLENQTKEANVQEVAQHLKIELERIKWRIKADVERIKQLHGQKTSDESVYTLQADSLDSVLTHLSVDSSINVDKQKLLSLEIHNNSKALFEKSREMASKARELEEVAEKREDLADDLTEKAKVLAEEQNPLPLSQRFPLHFGFHLRFTGVGPFSEDIRDILLLHGAFVTYSFTPNMEVGLQDLTVYSQQTIYGERYAIAGAPSVQFSFFPVKRLQLGAVGGLSVQGRVGCDRPAKMSVAPFIAVLSEVWIRNHFSISPIVRLNYAAYGPYYTVALNDHSGVLPQGTVWLDFGLSYSFNF
jgi:hypothetical protein